MKYLRYREDALPSPPNATELDGKQPILQTIALTLAQRDPTVRSAALADAERRLQSQPPHVARYNQEDLKGRKERFRWRARVEDEMDEKRRLKLKNTFQKFVAGQTS